MREVVDLLLKTHLPTWIVLVVFAAGTLIVSIYKYNLERKLKELSNNLAKEKFSYEKTVEFLQERHRKRLDLLDEVTEFLNEFSHSVHHICNGHLSYMEGLEVASRNLRSFTRKHENVLGEELKTLAHEVTDCGMLILQATWFVPSDVFNRVESEIRFEDRQPIRQLVDKEIKLNEIENYFRAVKDDLDGRTREYFIECGKIRGFDRNEYIEKVDKIRTLARTMSRTFSA